MDENQWQPARIHNAHLKPNIQGDPSADNRIVRIRLTTESAEYLASFRRCDAQKWYDLHPDDNGRVETVVCEHEILTD